jgi:CheY-like chemotaxis protein
MAEKSAILLSKGSGASGPVVELIGGPAEVVQSLATSLHHSVGYTRIETTAQPRVCLVVDAMDEQPDDVVVGYVRKALAAPPRPIPLFLTPRPERFRHRGLAWESEFLFPAGHVNLDELDARIQMLIYMWGSAFPVDMIRDSVVGSFRMMMQMDADDYHHRSVLVEDLQRCADWDGKAPPPVLRVMADGNWRPPLQKDHPYAALFPNAYSQLGNDLQALSSTKAQVSYGDAPPQEVRDRANTILRKIPGASGRGVHSLGSARPHVLIIDDEAHEIAETLGNYRVGYECDSASLSTIFHLVAERLTLEGKPPAPSFFETWIRERATGQVAPGNALHDLRAADLILLDLSLNQGEESELAGFILLEKLRKAIPEIPLVIHTGSAALGHIIQAIRNGADWYVRKDAARPYSDLASILSDIGRRPEWHKRATRLAQERGISKDSDLNPALQRDEYLYIWRCLAADLPSGELRVQPFSAGASGAVTCGIDVIGGASDDPAPRYPRASLVAKIDRPYVMVSERERFRNLVRPFIGNRAGRIDSEVVYAGPNVAGIAYTFSGIHQGQKGESRTAIQPFGNFLSRALDSRTAAFAEVAPVFHELLYDLLHTLHGVQPSGTRGDWLEPLFDETPTLRASHELRLPPRLEIELTSFSDPALGNITDVANAKIGDDIVLPLCRIQKATEAGFSVSFCDGETQHTHRAKLTGDVARFLARFRNLRPNRALSIAGRVVRTRDSFYVPFEEEFRDDLNWLTKNDYANPFRSIDPVLDIFDAVDRETVGTVHGDLNLNNILIDVDNAGQPVRSALWLIDFARTRRDSLAHDFAELEVDLVTRLLATSPCGGDNAAMIEFLGSLDAGPLYNRQRFDATTAFVGEACQFIRRAASAAHVDKLEYLATLVMYYLIVLKLNRPAKTPERYGDVAPRLRRWSLFGASAACKELVRYVEIRNTPPTEARLWVKRWNEQEPMPTRSRTRPAPRIEK